jgi:hypothetical protein
MGRPIPERFFNGTGGAGSPGGEGISSLTVEGGNSYSAGTTISFSASPIGGTTATATITFVAPADNAPGNGNVATASITEPGSGYTSVPTVTFNKPANVVVDGFTQIAGKVFKFSSGVTSGIYAGMVANAFFTTTTLGNPTKVVSVDVASGNITMSTANTAAISSPVSFGDVGRLGDILPVLIPAVTTANTIQGNAYITLGSGGRLCDILSQKGSRRYRVTNDQGTDTVRLVPTGINGNEDANNPTVAAVTAAGGPVAAGQITIQASDSDGGTYWVGKLEGQTALVFPGGTGTPGTQFTANTHVIWSMNAAVASTSVKLATND